MEEIKPDIEQPIEDNYSPYCSICTGCGEDGCCSAMCCEQHPDGKYCATYLKELQFGYLMYKKLYNLICKDEKYFVAVDKLWDQTWNTIYIHSDPDFIKWSDDAGYYPAYMKDKSTAIFWNRNDVNENLEKCYLIEDIYESYRSKK